MSQKNFAEVERENTGNQISNEKQEASLFNHITSSLSFDTGKRIFEAIKSYAGTCEHPCMELGFPTFDLKESRFKNSDQNQNSGKISVPEFKNSAVKEGLLADNTQALFENLFSKNKHPKVTDRNKKPAETLSNPESSGYLHGVNLSGAEFGANNLPGRSGTDYTFPTTQELDYYAAKGMNLIRLPFLWERMQQGLMNKSGQDDPRADRSFDPQYAAQMDQFLAETDKRGIKVVLDAQQFGRYNGQVIGASNITDNDFQSFWQQMAKTFGKHESIFGYDLSNEPHDEDNKVWHDAAQSGLNGVRAAGDNHVVLVEGNGWSGAQWWTDNNNDLILNDPANNIIYQAHTYWDSDHSGTYRDGPQASYDRAVADARNQNLLKPDEDPSDLGVNEVKPYMDWLKKNNLRGMIGEFGVPSNDERWVKMQHKFLDYMRQNNMPVIAWGGGPWWGKEYVLSLETGPKGPDSVDGPPPLSLVDMAGGTPARQTSPIQSGKTSVAKKTVRTVS